MEVYRIVFGRWLQRGTLTTSQLRGLLNSRSRKHENCVDIERMIRFVLTREWLDYDDC